MVDNTVYGSTACFSPDGRRIVTSSDDGAVRVWRVAMEEATPGVDLDSDTASGFGPRGQFGRGMELVFTPGYIVTTARFSPDGKHILVGGTNGQVALHDADDGRRRITFRGTSDEKGWVQSCEYTPDGRRVLATSGSGIVHLWDATSGQELLTLQPFPDVPGNRLENRVGMTPDGRRIVMQRYGLIRIVDVPTIDPLPNLGPAELVLVRFAELILREDVVARLRTEPALAPAVRAAALELAKTHPESADEIRGAMWDGRYPASVETSVAARQLRLAEAYLRLRPNDPHGLLPRAAALYHLQRDAEAEAVLAGFTVAPEKGQRGTPAPEGARLAFLALARVRLGKEADARSTLRELEKLAVANPDWERAEVLGELLALTRKSVPPPPIPKAGG